MIGCVPPRAEVESAYDNTPRQKLATTRTKKECSQLSQSKRGSYHAKVKHAVTLHEVIFQTVNTSTHELPFNTRCGDIQSATTFTATFGFIFLMYKTL